MVKDVNIMKKSICLIMSLILFVLVIGGCSNAGENTSKKIGIIGAMEEEVASLKEALTDTKTTTIAGMEFCEGKMGLPDLSTIRSISETSLFRLTHVSMTIR